ncbi:MAG: hypothetical protein ABJA78_16260 [Ferruginibacter sp.]
MKKILVMILLCFGISGISFGQTEVKVKKTSTIPQKVHNTFSRHKHYNGTVVKSKGRHHKRKHKHTTKKDVYKKD